MFLCPAVLQADGLIEDQMVCSGIGVDHEIADALELQILSRLLVFKVVFHITIAVDLQTVGIEELTEVAVVSRRVLDIEQTVILADLSLQTVVGRDPMQRSLHTTVGTRESTAALRVVLGLYLNDITLSILCTSSALHDVCILQTDFLARCHTEELLRSVLHEIGALYPQVLGEHNLVFSRCLVLRVVDSRHLLALVVGVISDNEFHWVKDRTDSCSLLVEVIADGSLEERNVIKCIKLGITDGTDEITDALG